MYVLCVGDVVYLASGCVIMILIAVHLTHLTKTSHCVSWRENVHQIKVNALVPAAPVQFVSILKNFAMDTSTVLMMNILNTVVS